MQEALRVTQLAVGLAAGQAIVSQVSQGVHKEQNADHDLKYLKEFIRYKSPPFEGKVDPLLATTRGYSTASLSDPSAQMLKKDSIGLRVLLPPTNFSFSPLHLLRTTLFRK